MNLRDLRYFIAVSKYRHFGKAAEACHVSQPTLSSQLKKMEDFLGVTLFERDNKNVCITAIGEKILEKAERAVFEADQIVDIAKLSHNPFAGELVIGVIPTVAPYLLPRITNTLKRAYPELKLLIKEDKTGNLIEDLKHNNIGVMLQPLPMDLGNFHQHVVYREDFWVAVPEQHPWATRKYIERDEINGNDLLLLEKEHCLRGHILEQLCHLPNNAHDYDFKATSLETLRHMVIGGIGMTVMPEMAVNDYQKGIVYVPFADPKPYRDVALVWRKNFSREPLIQKIAATLRNTLDSSLDREYLSVS